MRKRGERRRAVSEQRVRVECYSGYKADERPVRILFDEKALEVAEIEDRWYSPGATYFRVLVRGGERYVLRRDDAQDVWSLTAFRAAEKQTNAKIN